MFRERPVLKSAAGAAVLLSTALLLAAQSDVIRVDVNLVRVLAVVRNVEGNPVGTLKREDFRISDNGAPQEIALFERSSALPLNVAILLDTSGSTAKEIKAEIDSVNKFLRAIVSEGDPRDAIAAFEFNWRVTQRHGFTRNAAAIEQSLRGIKPEAGTCLYDAVFLAAEQLQEREGRRILVIVTDGGDTTSIKNFHAALEAAQVADAVVYPLLVLPITNDAGRNIGGENAMTLLAQGTGGRVFTPGLGFALDKAFAEILRDLRTQYLLGFYPKGVPPAKDRFHKLRVQVAGDGLQVSARAGYYGESQGAVAAPGRVSIAAPNNR